MNAFPKKFGMITKSVLIYRERNTIICINLSVMFDNVATRILSDIIYPKFIITLAPFIVFFSCQRFVNTNRIVTGTPICSKVNNLCHILFFYTLPVTKERAVSYSVTSMYLTGLFGSAQHAC